MLNEKCHDLLGRIETTSEARRPWRGAELRERGFFRDKRALQTGSGSRLPTLHLGARTNGHAAAAYSMPAALLLEGHVNTTTLRDARPPGRSYESLRTRS
jgi:hypothetical protein